MSNDLEIRPMGLNDFYQIKKSLRKRDKLSYDKEWLKLDRMTMCYCFYYNNELVMFSGIDYLEDEMRILTRGTTFKGCPKPWGPSIEEKTFPTVMAGISVKYSKYVEPTRKIVITINKGTRNGNVFRNAKKHDWMKYRETKDIYNVPQDIYDVDEERCHKMTEKWCNKYGIKYGEEDVWM